MIYSDKFEKKTLNSKNWADFPEVCINNNCYPFTSFTNLIAFKLQNIYEEVPG